jgi:hypothetical protein
MQARGRAERQPRALRVSVGRVTFPPCRVSSRAQSSCFSAAAVAALPVNQVYPGTLRMGAQLAAWKPAPPASTRHPATTCPSRSASHHRRPGHRLAAQLAPRRVANSSAGPCGTGERSPHSYQLPNPAPASSGPRSFMWLTGAKSRRAAYPQPLKCNTCFNLRMSLMLRDNILQAVQNS